MSGCGCGNGNNCTDGLNGLNAFTVTTANFTQPAVGSNVTVSVSVSGQLTGLWAVAGQIIFIQVGGFYEVVSVNQIGSQITVKNLGVSGYAAPAATITAGNKVSPAGYQGEEGVSVVSAAIVGGNLILTLSDGSTINAGAVVGSAGINQLYNNTSMQSFTGAGANSYATYAMPSGTFAVNGSTLEIEAMFELNGSGAIGEQPPIQLLLNSTGIFPNPITIGLKEMYRVYFHIKLERVSATSVNVVTTLIPFGGTLTSPVGYFSNMFSIMNYNEYSTGVSVPNLDSTAINIGFRKSATAASAQANLAFMKVRYYKLG